MFATTAPMPDIRIAAIIPGQHVSARRPRDFKTLAAARRYIRLMRRAGYRWHLTLTPAT